MNAISSATQGIIGAQNALATNSVKIANGDLDPSLVVQNMQAKTTAVASMAVIKTSNDLQKSLMDIVV
jgi:hypothetical protein